MDELLKTPDAWVVALVFAAAIFFLWGVGWRRGQRLAEVSGDDPGTKFIDAGVAILGLLLAFTFAMALGRHDQRRLTIVDESNALGDFYTCASLLQPSHRSQLQAAIRDYATFQLETPFEKLPEKEYAEAIARSQGMYSQMTGIVREAIAANTPIANPLTNTLNNVSSTNASRLASYEEHLPWSAVMLLLLSSVVPAFLIGEKQGLSRKPSFTASISFMVLVTLVMYVTLDLNQPRRGLIQVNMDPMKRVIEGMN